MIDIFSVKLPPGERYNASLIYSERSFRWWLGAVRQQVIIKVSVYLDLCRHVASFGHNELIIGVQFYVSILGVLSFFKDPFIPTYRA